MIRASASQLKWHGYLDVNLAELQQLVASSSAGASSHGSAGVATTQAPGLPDGDTSSNAGGMEQYSNAEALELYNCDDHAVSNPSVTTHKPQTPRRCSSPFNRAGVATTRRTPAIPQR